MGRGGLGPGIVGGEEDVEAMTFRLCYVAFQPQTFSVRDAGRLSLLDHHFVYNAFMIRSKTVDASFLPAECG